jgi:hypothetical protein
LDLTIRVHADRLFACASAIGTATTRTAAKAAKQIFLTIHSICSMTEMLKTDRAVVQDDDCANSLVSLTKISAQRMRGRDHNQRMPLQTWTCGYSIFGRGAETAPASSSSLAMRSAISSRHGGAMICTPIGSGFNGTGTETTGSPMNDTGCV